MRYKPVCCLSITLLWTLPLFAQESPNEPSSDDNTREQPTSRETAPDPEQPDGEPPDFMRMSLEELMDVQVTSVAGIGQDWFTTPAALEVITGDDVRRSGHRSVAESLRMVPGFSVLRTDANTWNVGSRGNGGFTNKLLVLRDGRATYDLLFSGTFWDVQDFLFEDLERMEIIRGPGATLWGANAVNGVINITTKSARDTQGFYGSAGFGTFERAFGEARYGFAIDDDSWARVWGRWADYDHFEIQGPDDAHDEWDMSRGGFRYDHEGDDGAFLMLQAEAYGSDRIGERLVVAGGGAPILFDARADGGHGLFRFGKQTNEGGWALQGYYDRTSRSTAGGFQVDRDTFDLDFRHNLHLGEAHAVVWGAAVRHTRDRTDAVTNPLFFLAFEPRDRSADTVSAFVQDTITLAPDRLFVMFGSKFEHNDFTGFEVQPGARLWWTPNDRNTLWGAISRAVRTPTRTEEDLAIGVPGFVFEGNTDVEAEDLTAYEAGYRRKITDTLTADASVFFNDYHDFITTRTLSPPATFPILLSFENAGTVQTVGGEIASTWQVADNWRLRGSYSVIEIDTEGFESSNPEGGTPQQQAQLRSLLDVTENLEWNTALYYTDNIPNFDVDHYLRLDTGITWRVNDHFDLSLWGQNLLEGSHRESTGPAEFVRAAYFQATFRY